MCYYIMKTKELYIGEFLKEELSVARLIKERAPDNCLANSLKVFQKILFLFEILLSKFQLVLGTTYLMNF